VSQVKVSVVEKNIVPVMDMPDLMSMEALLNSLSDYGQKFIGVDRDVLIACDDHIAGLQTQNLCTMKLRQADSTHINLHDVKSWLAQEQLHLVHPAELALLIHAGILAEDALPYATFWEYDPKYYAGLGFKHWHRSTGKKELVSYRGEMIASFWQFTAWVQ